MIGKENNTAALVGVSHDSGRICLGTWYTQTPAKIHREIMKCVYYQKSLAESAFLSTVEIERENI
jgi:hypothetical protein